MIHESRTSASVRVAHRVRASFAWTKAADTDEVYFTNLSGVAGSYLWDFGDFTTSPDKDQVRPHVYEVFPSREYTVTLTLRAGIEVARATAVIAFAWGSAGSGQGS